MRMATVTFKHDNTNRIFRKLSVFAVLTRELSKLIVPINLHLSSEDVIRRS